MVGIDGDAIFIARNVPHRPELFIFGEVDRVFFAQDFEGFQHILAGIKLGAGHIEAADRNIADFIRCTHFSLPEKQSKKVCAQMSRITNEKSGLSAPALEQA